MRRPLPKEYICLLKGKRVESRELPLLRKVSLRNEGRVDTLSGIPVKMESLFIIKAPKPSEFEEHRYLKYYQYREQKQISLNG